MTRIFFAVIMTFITFSTFSAEYSKPVNSTVGNCSNAVPTNDPGFCASFKAVAKCHCMSNGLPAGLCSNMNLIYSQMILIYRSIDNACNSQRSTTPQDCKDNWKCYREGGIDSQGRVCSSTQQKCS